MFSEPQLPPVPSSIPTILSVPISPLSSKSPSPSPSTSNSRTSTITSNSYLRSDATQTAQSNLTQNCFQQQQQQQQPHRQMKIGKYFLEKTIGKGNFAVVKLATHCDTQQKV